MTRRLQILDRRRSVLRMLGFSLYLLLHGYTGAGRSVGPPTCVGGREGGGGGGGGGSGHSYSQPKILTLSHILSPFKCSAYHGMNLWAFNCSCCSIMHVLHMPCDAAKPKSHLSTATTFVISFLGGLVPQWKVQQSAPLSHHIAISEPIKACALAVEYVVQDDKTCMTELKARADSASARVLDLCRDRSFDEEEGTVCIFGFLDCGERGGGRLAVGPVGRAVASGGPFHPFHFFVKSVEFGHPGDSRTRRRKNLGLKRPKIAICAF